MKTKSLLFIIAAILVICVFIVIIVLLLFNPFKTNNSHQNPQTTPQTIMTQSASDKAIAKVKAQNPDLKDYPSDLLPPKSIRYAELNGTWYVAFLQEGSGVPLISAKCFTVDGSGVVTLFSEFTPQQNEVLNNNFSPISCKLL